MGKSNLFGALEKKSGLGLARASEEPDMSSNPNSPDFGLVVKDSKGFETKTMTMTPPHNSSVEI